MATTVSAVRTALQISSEDVLNDATIEQAISDAQTQLNTSDELAERYFTCYLLAMDVDWNSVNSIGDGVSFNKPKPENFEKKYKFRLRQLGLSLPKKTNWESHDDTEIG